MNYKYEIGNPLTDEIIENIKKEAQKELLEEFQKEMYEQNVDYICDFEIQHKLEELSDDTTTKGDKKE